MLSYWARESPYEKLTFILPHASYHDNVKFLRDRLVIQDKNISSPAFRSSNVGNFRDAIS